MLGHIVSLTDLESVFRDAVVLAYEMGANKVLSDKDARKVLQEVQDALDARYAAQRAEIEKVFPQACPTPPVSN